MGRQEASGIREDMLLQRVLISLDQGQRLNIITGHNAPTSCGAATKQELRKVEIICWLTYDLYLLLLIGRGWVLGDTHLALS